MSLPRKKHKNYLTPYRRHAPNCTEKKSHVRCDCPIWCQGRIGGKYIREALNTRSMATAEHKINHRLAHPEGPGDGPDGGQSLIVLPGAHNVSLEDAERSFLSAKKKTAPNTQAFYQKTISHFRGYCESHRAIVLHDVASDHINQYFIDYDKLWQSQRTKIQKLKILRIFFGYAVSKKWLTESPAADETLSFSKPTGHPRRPYTPEQVQRILQAVETMPEPRRATARALVLLLLYSGQRISDAVWLQRQSLNARNRLDYWIIKTQTRVGLRPELHQDAVDALNALPPSRVFFFVPDREDDYREAVRSLEQGKYFQNYVTDYQLTIDRFRDLIGAVLKRAGLHGGPHTFRDTFAVNMLTNGADIYAVSQMLGHSSIKITEEHYLNLVEGYRERMSEQTRKLNYAA